MTTREWIDSAPDNVKDWLTGVSVLNFLAKERNTNFQMVGMYDGSMSEECKASFQLRHETSCELFEAVKAMTGK